MTKHRLMFLIMLILIPLAGELKFYPFNTDFRVSLGTPVFFFFLLWTRNNFPVLSGLVVGLLVVAFRVFLETRFNLTGWVQAFYHHFPVFFYYLTYGAAFSLTKIKSFYRRPLFIGIFGVIIEVAASMVEILLRNLAIGKFLTWSMVLEIIFFAVIRSFFVLSFFEILILREAQLAEQEQRKRTEQMLIFVSNLYVETVQLKKSMQNAEDITRTSYELYRKLIEFVPQGLPADLAQSALTIAGQVHEIKKDSQRTYAGLSKIISDRNLGDFMSPKDLANIVIKSNQQYAGLLGKSINFHLDISNKHACYHTYTVLSLLNNLASNAVEAIENEGTIWIQIARDLEEVEFRVTDDGPGIRRKNLELIFKHGFTTKYDISGKPSTGIGLSYVKDLVETLGGRINVQTSANPPRTVFTINLPATSLEDGAKENEILHC